MIDMNKRTVHEVDDGQEAWCDQFAFSKVSNYAPIDNTLVAALSGTLQSNS